MTGDFNITLRSGVAIQPGATIKPDKYLSDLKFAVMLAGEVRKGEWALAPDLIYVDLSSLSSHVKSLTGPGGIVSVRVNAGVSLDLRAAIWTTVAATRLCGSRISPQLGR